MPTPTTLVVDSGNNQVAQINTAFANAVGVRLYDEFGNWMSGVSITFNAGGPFSPFPGGVFTGANPYVVATGGDGRAVTSVMSANAEVGAWVGQVFVTAVPAVSTTFNATNTLTPPTPVLTYITVTSGGTQIAARNTAFDPVTIRGYDQFFAAISGVLVTMTVPAGRGTFPGGVLTDNQVTNASGDATFAAVTASATLGAFNPSITGGSASPVSTDFTTIDPTVVTSLTVYSGNNQTAAPSFPYAQPLVGRVANAVNSPVAGVSVTFDAPNAGASIVWDAPFTDPVVVVSDVNGLATTPTFAANGTAGTFTVNATYPGAVRATFFQLTNGGSPPAESSALIICEV